jgi:hypothetical protein
MLEININPKIAYSKALDITILRIIYLNLDSIGNKFKDLS